MTTTRTIPPLSLTDNQVRHLNEHGRVKIVIPCNPQPPHWLATQLACGQRKIIDLGDGRWGAGTVVGTATAVHTDNVIRSPYQPGDVVPCRERWADVNTEGGPAFMYADGTLHFCGDDAFPVEYDRYPGCHFSMWFSDLLYAKQRKCTDDHKWRSVASMPEYLIRLRPVCETVECRRVDSISECEGVETGFYGERVAGRDNEEIWIADPVDQFKDDWHRRYRKPEYAFGRVFGWFYDLVLKGDE